MLCCTARIHGLAGVQMVLGWGGESGTSSYIQKIDTDNGCYVAPCLVIALRRVVAWRPGRRILILHILSRRWGLLIYGGIRLLIYIRRSCVYLRRAHVSDYSGCMARRR